MTEDEKLAFCSVMHRLNAMSHALDALTMFAISRATPGFEKRKKLLDRAEECTRLREESDAQAAECADKVNEMWGGGDE